MTVPRFARLAARTLASADGAGSPRPSKEDRDRAVAAIAEAMVARRRRATMGRWALGAAAAAAALAAGTFAYQQGHRTGTEVAGSMPTAARSDGDVVVVAHSVGAGAELYSEDRRAVLSARSDILPGSRVVTAAGGGAALALSTGSELGVGGGSELQVIEVGAMQRFMLRSGSVNADVSHLRDGERFIVGTPDAEIEVHGTSFRVEVLDPSQACDGSRTRVTVREGVVSVTRGGATVHVRPGQHWPQGCEVGAASATVTPGAEPAPIAGALPEPRMAPPSHAVAPGPERVRGSAPASDAETRSRPSRESVSPLAEENTAFGRAVAMRRGGDRAAALDAFQRFLLRYPDGPLTESAAVERMRLLSEMDEARAIPAADAYLRTYPSGFARDEASAIVAHH